MKFLNEMPLHTSALILHKGLQTTNSKKVIKAARILMQFFIKHSYTRYTFYIFYYEGRKGTLGFQLGKLLTEKGFKVFVFKKEGSAPPNVNSDSGISPKCKALRLLDFSAADEMKFKKNAVIIDALYEEESNKPLSKKQSDLILKLNATSAVKVAVNCPSGLLSNEMTPAENTVFKADFTLSVEGWKIAFLHQESAAFCGKVKILKSFNNKNVKKSQSSNFLIDDQLIKNIYRPRTDFSNKGTYGKSAIIAGSYGKMGAAVMAVQAALHSGSGLTFALNPECGFTIMQAICPEAMFISGGKKVISKLDVPENAVIAIGPGTGTKRKTQKAFIKLLQQTEKPMVIDADALNMLSENRNEFQNIPAYSILTPHPKEFARLFGKTKDSFEAAILAQKKAQELKVIIILKGHHTQIFVPDGRVFYNVTGNSGMAKGGSGDVLTGILTALISQNYSSAEAALFGVWLHGAAGDRAAKKLSKEAMLPLDLIKEIGNVFLQLNS